MTQAHDFLNRVLPWPPAGVAGAYMNIHYSVAAPDGKTFWRGFACQSLDDMVSKVAWVKKFPDTLGIYACMSSQRTADLRQSKSGHNYYAAVRSLQNAVEHKSFYIDVDVKEKGYATEEEATHAFLYFVRDAKLPYPTAVVATGSGGFHAHWTISQPVPSETWKPYAQALANAVQKFSLKADTQCTIDAARILRIPDTYNKKSGNPVPVVFKYTVSSADIPNADLFKALDPYLSAVPDAGVLPVAFKGATPATVIPLDTLGAGISREARPVYIDEVAKQCAFVSDALKDGGKDYSEPLWNLTTLLATFTEGKRDDAHAMAKGHPEYTEQSTNDKYNRKLIDRQNNVGWPQCRTITASGCGACQVCPHKDEGRSPLHFGHRAPDGEPIWGKVSVEDLPYNYTRHAYGQVYRVMPKEGDDGAQDYKRLSTNAMVDPRVQAEPYVLSFETMVMNDKKRINVPYEAMSHNNELSKCLLKQGFTVQTGELKPLGTFFMAWIDKLQGVKDAVHSSSFCGWMYENGKPAGFTYAGKTYTANGERPAAYGDDELRSQYSIAGSLDIWKESAKLITDQRRPALDALLACSFAAPLVKFTGQEGMTVSAFSESGTGKTSAMKVAAAVWGDPIRTMQATDDTNTSVFLKIGALKHLPLFWDDLKTNDDINKMVQLAFRITSGKDRSRSTQAITLRHVGTWQTLLVIASNGALVDEVTRQTEETDAGINRLFEFTVAPGTGHGSATEFGQAIGRTNINHGHAGAIYAQFLGERPDTIAAIVAQSAKYFEAQCTAQRSERFWVACAAAIYAGARCSNHLGLTDIDLDGLKVFLVETIESMRRQRDAHSSDTSKSINIESLLGGYLSAKKARNTLTTDLMILGAGKPGRIRVIEDTSRLEGVYVHVATKSRAMRLTESELRDWLRARKLNVVSFINRLVKEFGFKRAQNVIIGAGTRFAVPAKQNCLDVMTAGTFLQDYFDQMEGNLPKEEIQDEVP